MADLVVALREQHPEEVRPRLPPPEEYQSPIRF